MSALGRLWERLRGRGPSRERRFEAANTTRLNSGLWSRATTQRANRALATDLLTVRQRAIYEAANNPIVRGVIHTHAACVVGSAGPRLQIRCADPAYSAARERVWRAWWRCPDAAGILSGPALLRQWVSLRWTHGESVGQLVSVEPTDRRDVALRVLSVDPTRIPTPPDAAAYSADERVVMGIRVDDNGRPLEYLVERASWSDYVDRSYRYDHVPAASIVHYYLQDEPEQMRGWPLLAYSLDAIAELRAYDAEVLDAARAAASWGVLLYADSPEAPFLSADATLDVERRTQQTLPPGWRPMQVQGNQPMTVYESYRAERQREIGRPVSMPLMTVRLDSVGHSYSSARFDDRAYAHGSIDVERNELDARVLDRLEREVAREATIAGILPAEPLDVERVWYWPPHESVDPTKDAEAEATGLETGTLSLTEALALRGRDLEEHVAERQAEAELLASAGLPMPWTKAPTSPTTTPTEPVPDPASARRVNALLIAARRDPRVALQLRCGQRPPGVSSAEADMVLNALGGPTGAVG